MQNKKKRRIPVLRFTLMTWLLLLVSFSTACSLTRKAATVLTPTLTRLPSVTLVPSSTHTPTRTATLTPSPTRTATPNPTLTFTPTATNTVTPTPTQTATPTRTLSPGESLLLQAETAMQSVLTLGMNINLTTSSGIIPIVMKGSGIAERPDKVYVTLSLFFQKYEVLNLGNDEVYVKVLGSDTWERTPIDQMDLPTSLLRNAFRLIDVRDTALSPMVAGTEDVNGITCQQLTLGINLPLYLAQRAPGASSQIDLAASRARGQLWIGVNDSRIHKLYIEMELVSQGETIPVNATIEFNGFNEPVTFPARPGS